ncbi:MAG: UvrD-helicase domain-containing protein [Chthoniobacterales bacterium]
MNKPTSFSNSSIRYIRASAGSGKTYTLSSAYLSLLLKSQGQQAGNILATTFTRAAAGEIFERVLQRLAEAVLDSGAAKQLLSESKLSESDASVCADTLQTLTQQLHRIGISTIDSFFARIARGMPEQLGLNPDWKIVSASTTNELASQAILEVLEQTPEAFHESYFYWKQHLQSALNLELLRNLLETVLFKPLTGDSRNNWQCTDIPLTGKAFTEEFARAIDLKNWKKDDGKLISNKNVIKGIEKARSNCHADLKLHKAWFDIVFLKNHLEGKDSYYKIPCPPELSAFVEKHAPALRELCQNLLADQETALARLKSIYQKTRLDLTSTSGSQSFAEIEYRVLNALENDPELDPEEIGDAWSDLYFVLDGQVQHLLFDEFQDTSRSQYQFFKPLIEECASQEDRSVVVVGDPKQAIYGWRGGDREVIDQFPLKHLSKIEDLKFSYRSSPKVLEFVDQVFENLENIADYFKAPFSKAVADWMGEKDSPLRYQGHKSKRSDLSGEVGIWATDSEKETLSESILQRVRDLQARPSPPKRIGILVSKNKFIFEAALILRQAGITDVAAKTSKAELSASFPIELIIATLTLIEHPHIRSAALALASHAPWCKELRDANLPKEKLFAFVQKWRKQLVIHGLEKVIRIFGEHEEFQNLLTTRDRFFYTQLLAMADSFDKENSERIDQFISGIRNEQFKISREARIQIMTIHASKGLEFEAVILAGLDSRGSSSSSFNTITREDGKQALVPSSEIQAIAAGEEKRVEEYKRKNLSEKLSQIYVALTRAQSYLHVIIDKKADFRKDKDPLPVRAGTLIRMAVETTDPDSSDGCIFLSKQEAATTQNPRPPKIKLPHDSAFSDLKKNAVPTPASSLPRLERACPSLAGTKQKKSFPDKTAFSLESLCQENSQIQNRGLLAHACLEQISWIEDGLPETADLLYFIESQAEDSEFVAHLLNEIKSPRGTLHPYFSRKFYEEKWNCIAEDLQLWRERPFTLPLEGKLWSGRFDRVVVLAENQTFQHAEIIDFKTRLSDSPQKKISSSDTQQIEIYRKILENSLKISPGQIETSIVEISFEAS